VFFWRSYKRIGVLKIMLFIMNPRIQVVIVAPMVVDLTMTMDIQCSVL
jgi:hypothetical protein